MFWENDEATNILTNKFKLTQVQSNHSDELIKSKLIEKKIIISAFDF